MLTCARDATIVRQRMQRERGSCAGFALDGRPSSTNLRRAEHSSVRNGHRLLQRRHQFRQVPPLEEAVRMVRVVGAVHIKRSDARKGFSACTVTCVHHKQTPRSSGRSWSTSRRCAPSTDRGRRGADRMRCATRHGTRRLRSQLPIAVHTKHQLELSSLYDLASAPPSAPHAFCTRALQKCRTHRTCTNP